MTTNEKTLKAKTVDIRLRDDFEAGRITLLEAAREFCKNGWTNFVDENAARRFMERAAF